MLLNMSKLSKLEASAPPHTLIIVRTSHQVSWVWHVLAPQEGSIQSDPRVDSSYQWILVGSELECGWPVKFTVGLMPELVVPPGTIPLTLTNTQTDAGSDLKKDEQRYSSKDYKGR